MKTAKIILIVLTFYICFIFFNLGCLKPPPFPHSNKTQIANEYQNINVKIHETPWYIVVKNEKGQCVFCKETYGAAKTGYDFNGTNTILSIFTMTTSGDYNVSYINFDKGFTTYAVGSPLSIYQGDI